jgi:hypothetical protein
LESVAITEYKNKNDYGHYKSLTEVTKISILSDDIDYNNHVYVFVLLKMIFFFIINLGI